jgi:hypothetical protein
MKIEELQSQEEFLKLFEKDENGRDINIYQLKNVVGVGTNLIYPNILFYSLDNNNLITPINEKIMSLIKLENNNDYPQDKLNDVTKYNKIETNPLFFFVYNTDNYFHFIYDTLPYLISFLQIKKTIPNIKLLMNYPNKSKKSHYDFVLEFLSMLGINDDDILLIDSNILYKEIYISTSYTHGVDSNKPPRKEIYSFYNQISSKNNFFTEQPKKIYVSRRSWIHGDFSNIGTNYTNRRKMVNEDELVNFLIKNGYSEIFTEKLTTSEKISLFKNATHIVGSLGGGISNVLFSPKETKLIAIESPDFLTVNSRFIYSLNNVDLTIFNDTKHINNNVYKKHMRVKFGNIIGEITDIIDDKITISYTEEFVAGWNNNLEYKTIIIEGRLCEKLDSGLNSEWMINLENFKKLFYD